MPALATDNLRLVNCKLRSVLDSWHSRPDSPDSIGLTVFSDLLTELSQASGSLHGISSVAAPDLELQKEIHHYHNNLKELERSMPTMRARLLIERARLESARTHLKAAEAWADARKETL